CYRLTTEGKGLPAGALKRAPKQAALVEVLQQRHYLAHSELKVLGITPAHAKTLIEKKLIEKFELTRAALATPTILREQPLILSSEQATALENITTHGFQVSLLDGATGSG